MRRLPLRSPPRMRGKAKNRCRSCPLPGSPPRMRGKAVAIFRQLHHGRITPAYAGKRDSIPQQSSLRRDHPRVCGEKPRIFFMSIRSAGSPPRMRGKGQPLYIVVSESGITPACAGKSLVRELLLIVSRDHPRVCGEKFRAYAKIWNEWGSPPRMRGKGTQFLSNLRCVGITPACAGKSVAITCRAWYPRDHPRVCGEKEAGALSEVYETGSPPRVRGKAPKGVRP